MAIDPSSSSKSNLSANGKKGKPKSRKSNNHELNDPQKRLARRTKSPGIRVVGGRIYDSENGKTCHQCRQKTKDFVAVCRNHRNSKACPLMYCHKCLLNRYGEKAEEVSALEDWSCPKCKGICNCSLCMKKRGHQPTGILAHTAKANGYSSVSEMLQVGGPTIFNHEKLVKDMGASPRKRAAMEMDAVIISPVKPGKENIFSGKIDSNLCPASPLDSVMEKPKKAKLEGSRKRQSDNGAVDTDGNASAKTKLLGGQGKKDNQPLVSAMFADEKKLKKPKQGKLNGTHDDTFVRRTSPRKHKQSNETLSNNGTGEADGNTLSKRKMLEGQELKPIGHPKQISVEIILQNPKQNNLLESAVNTDEKKSQNLKKDMLNGVHDGILVKRTSPRKLKQPNETLNRMSFGLNAGPPDKEPVKANSLLFPRMENMEKLDDHDSQLKATGKSMDINMTYQRVRCDRIDDDNQLPSGVELTSIDGIEIQPEDVGKALQFLEFCAAFRKVLDVKKGQPESVLKDLLHGRTSRQGKHSATVQFHIHLISVIQEEREGSVVLSSSNGKQLWVQALKECISESESVLSSVAFNHLCKRADGYENLKSSEKLQILNVLCDEVLGTAKIRSWIDDQISKHSERAKEQKERVAGAKNKEKSLKQKMQDEIAKAIVEKNGSFLSISEQEAIISQIKCEAAQAHSELLESTGMLSKTQEAPDAVRIEPVYLGTDGRVYWRLKSLSNTSSIVVQDIGSGNTMCCEKWFSFSEEQKEVIQKSINVLRFNRRRAEKFQMRHQRRNKELANQA